MQRPRVKPEHRPYRLADGTIRIGGRVYGAAAEIPDPSGAIWTLLTAMDGTRDPARLAAHVRVSHQEQSTDDILAAIGQLCASGYIEDGAVDPPDDFSETERERYSRSHAFYRWLDLQPREDGWQVQRMLRGARATVLGIGGTGGAAALALASTGVGRLHLVDRDVVDLSNLNRQLLYLESDLSRPKVDAAVRRLRQTNSDILVTGEQTEIRGAADIAKLADDCDILVMAADEPTGVRRWANEACLSTRTRWVNAGYSGPQVTATAYVPGDGPCFECVQAASDAEAPELWHDTDDRPKPRFAAASAVSGGMSGLLAGHLAIAQLTGVPAVHPGTVYAMTLIDLSHHFTRQFPRDADCPACAGRS